MADYSHGMRKKLSLAAAMIAAPRLLFLDEPFEGIDAVASRQIKDLLSKRRTRSLARPRQVAMALAKELTEHSLPEIGDAFAGRDHTTVLHACRQIRTLIESDAKLREDWDKLIRKLSE